MLELKILLTQLFAEAGAFGAPFTLGDISRTLTEAYGCVSYDCVRRAWVGLMEDDLTQSYVEPLAIAGRSLKFSADAARRIARRAVGGELPPKYRKTISRPKVSKPRVNAITASQKRPLKTKNHLSATKVQPNRK